MKKNNKSQLHRQDNEADEGSKKADTYKDDADDADDEKAEELFIQICQPPAPFSRYIEPNHLANKIPPGVALV